MKGYLLLFNPAENIILTIYFNRDAETLEEEVYDCRDEVNILSLLLRDWQRCNSGGNSRMFSGKCTYMLQLSKLYCFSQHI